ncbi:hypothetical protein B4U79_16775, partial [Dinothrombium tinctorium]
VKPENLKGVIGVNDLEKVKASDEIFFDRTIVNENYTIGPQNELINDIALLHVTKPIDFSSPLIKAVCLPAKGKTSYKVADVVGWGQTQPFGFTTTVLQTAVVYPFKERECVKRFKLDKKRLKNDILVIFEAYNCLLYKLREYKELWDMTQELLEKLLIAEKTLMISPEIGGKFISILEGYHGRARDLLIACYYHPLKRHTATTKGAHGYQSGYGGAGEWARNRLRVARVIQIV